MIWTLFKYGGRWQICSKHHTLKGAVRAAIECEDRGGAPHKLVKVEEIRHWRRGTLASRSKL